MRHSMKPDLRADYKIRLYTGPQNPVLRSVHFHSRFPDSFDIKGIYSMTDEGGISRRYDRHIGQFS